MFFSDPAAAFADIAAALRPGARLVLLVWQQRQQNEWARAIDAALAFVLGFQDTTAALAGLSDGDAARTVERLRATLAAHYSDERGVVLDSRSWLISGTYAA
jgi:hypothetical protein